MHRPPNNAFQPRRCALLAYRDRWHFDTITDLFNILPAQRPAERWPLGGSARSQTKHEDNHEHS